MNKAEIQANAALIASAPAMREALVQAMAALEQIASNMVEAGGCTAETELQRRKDIAADAIRAAREAVGVGS